MFFDEWFTEKVKEQGYKQINGLDFISHIWMTFQDGYDSQSKDLFHVCYLRSEMSPEAIRIAFTANHDEHVLFVVDERALRFVATDIPKWLKILHAIYYGRIYIYHNLSKNITALHYDWDAKTGTYSEPIDIDSILFTDTDCKLKDFPGIFHIARFYDRAFWKEQAAPPPKRERKQKQYKPPPSAEDVFRDFREAYERNKRAYEQANNAYYPPPRSYAPTGDKWLQQFVSAGDLATARALYKQLAKEWHPDLNPGKPAALETMQAINVAYARVKDILR